jgi:Asp-tRNA(Asn)/Glu-tRNA(Gln) amidotransferase A subunit family amidase
MMLSALDLARRIEAGELSPHAVVDMCADAIATREKDIHAFTALDIDAVRRAASAEELAATPLRGLPVGVKDIFDTVELPTEYGSAAYVGYQPRTDAAAVVLVRRAGGIVLGKTVTTEFAWGDPGPTRNPHNLLHTPGGSSSGSAAGVAAGMFPIALGSQTGGSVIRPAAYCGVAGFKPSYKLIPTVGMKCISWHLDTAGVFAAGIADVAFAAAVITGRDLRVDRAQPAAPRIALVRTQNWGEASPDMRRAVETAAADAERAGATVTDLDLPPIFAEADRAHAAINDYEAFRALAFEYDRHRDQLRPRVCERLDSAASVTADAYDAARRTARCARQILADLMAEADVLLTPSAAGAAPEGLGSTGVPIFNRLWTLLGLPCLNVPGFRDSAGLPLGVQVVGWFGRDQRALEAALFVEQAISHRPVPAREPAAAH